MGFFLATISQFMGVYVLILVLLIGTGKEVYDLLEGRKFDWLDLACTFAGGWIGFWITLIYQ